ncbi:hypothetical protein PoB_001275500 [Plakobranchus ocellatus]|uniref:Secreted protein n=1 Tax=Plakobranchus ocellatus TaxID=259542 RepID=A0AAV3YTW5_9GAST|nr:hypothetical protein PoB_001275500 [Plakobranchus ocellatus]
MITHAGAAAAAAAAAAATAAAAAAAAAATAAAAAAAHACSTDTHLIVLGIRTLRSFANCFPHRFYFRRILRALATPFSAGRLEDQ